MDHDYASEAIDLLREQLQTVLSSIDALDRKLALVAPVVAGVAVLAAPRGIGGEAPALLVAGIAVAVIAAGLSLWGMATRPVHLGPDAKLLAWRIRNPYPEYYLDTAQALQHSVNVNAALVRRKARSFNFAAVSAAGAIVLFLVARILEVG